MKKIFLIAAIIGVTFLLGAGTNSPLADAINTLDADTVLRHGSWSLTVMTADSGKIIAEKNPQLGMIPASTLKILTTGAALGLLGPDFRYETKLEYDGTFDINSGVLHGNLFLTGSGDPTFALDDWGFDGTDTGKVFEGIPARLAAFGIKKIEGDIVGDAGCFSDNPVPDDWTWSDMGQYYGAGTCGLAYRDNAVELHFNSYGKDSCSIDSVSPAIDGVQFLSRVIADGKKDEAFVYGAPYGNIYYVYGNIPPGKKNYIVKAADPDPAYQCVKDLSALMKHKGISFTGEITTVRRAGLKSKVYSGKRNAIYTISSQPLEDIVKYTNINSDNIFAEQLVRTLGYKKGTAGTDEAGVEVVKNYWRSLGVDLDGLYMTDGCGLSRSNTITTSVHAHILFAAYHQSWFNSFYNSLPVCGESGSMKNLCKGSSCENNMHAKTGYINKARGYAGFVKTKDGKTVCFSLLANNYSCNATEMRKRLEKILIAIADE
ncbi:MAG TPA: D-alanyl-D-alanine carboxypeptidase/D-alanyl-D-alanine-endopeptidase [Bacteroidia bacterium]|nr:D-alanyl-D-alanine carboxypeptidase/D-alanyl-D-alanine-endopeptidase [Bacteroidia bacterium]